MVEQTTEQLYIVKHNNYSGHFMYFGTEVTIEREINECKIFVRSTYGNKQNTAVVHKEEIELKK